LRCSKNWSRKQGGGSTSITEGGGGGNLLNENLLKPIVHLSSITIQVQFVKVFKTSFAIKVKLNAVKDARHFLAP